MTRGNTKFLFDFIDYSIKQEFKIKAIKENKSMTELLNELILRYLKK